MNPSKCIASVLVATALALGVSFPLAQAQTIISNTFTFTFPTTGPTEAPFNDPTWIYWYNSPGGNTPIITDPTTGVASPIPGHNTSTNGSLEVISPLAGGTQNVFFGTFADSGAWNENVLANITDYASISFDILVAPGTPLDNNDSPADFGAIGVGIINTGNGYQQLTSDPNGVTIPASADTNWYHVVVPISQLQALGNVFGICLDLNSYGGYPRFTMTNWIANIAINQTQPQPSFVTIAPAIQFAFAGSNATFTVTADGTPPFSYYWQFAGTNLISGGNQFISPTGTLTVSNVTAANAGSYSVVVSNIYGTAASTAAILNVSPPTPGLNLLITNTANQYAREMISAGDTGYSFIGHSNATYAWTIGQLPPVGHTNFQQHFFLIGDDTGSRGADDLADYDAPNVIFITVEANLDGSASMNFRWKTNEPSGNSLIFPASTNSYPPEPFASLRVPSGVGAWSVSFQANTNVTLTGPNGASTNFVFPVAAAQLFADPLVMFLGGQANAPVDEGLDIAIQNFSVSGVAKPFTDHFARDNGLSAPWINDSADPGSILLLPAENPVLTWATPAAITYGTALGTNQLDAAASVSGSFAYNPPTNSVPNAGTNTLSVVFTPNDTVDYTSATDTVALVVSPAPLTVTATATNRYYGQTNPVFTGTLTGVTNGDNITASYATTATTGSPVGTYAITPTLVDPNGRLANYTVTTNTGTLTVNKATPIVTTLPVASVIVYGQTLASSTLSGGAASVPGSLAFSTPSTMPSVGTALQSVTFTPSDTNDYNAVVTSISVTVNPALPVITWAAPAAITYGTALGTNQLDATANVPGSFIYTPPAGTVPTVGTDTLTVVFTPTNTLDYSSVTDSVNLAVNGAVASGGGSYLVTSNWFVANGAPGTHIATGDVNRSIAYGMLSNQVYVCNKGVSGSGTTPAIDVFNATSGAYLGSASMTGVSGGTFLLDQVAVADDGLLYGVNLTTSLGGTAFNLYQWNEYASAPTQCFSGDPSGGRLGGQRMGDNLAITGFGINTVILAPVMNSTTATTNVVLFSTANGTTFTPTLVQISGLPAPAGNVGPTVGVAFYTNNTFLFKPNGTTLYVVQYPANFSSLTQPVQATVIATNNSFISGSQLVLNYAPGGNLLAALGPIPNAAPTSTPISLFLANPISNAGSPVASTNSSHANANGNNVGGIALGGLGKTNLLFTLDCNNGVFGWGLTFVATPAVPAISSGPLGGLVYTNLGSFTFNVTAAGSLPLVYSWQYNAVSNLATASTEASSTNNSAYSLSPLATNLSGWYDVIVSNYSGSVTSAPVQLTVLAPLLSTNVTQLWSLAPGSRAYLGSNDYYTRGLAYDPISSTVLLADHGTTNLYALDANTGNDLFTLNTSGLYAGATFAVDQVGVADDGALYAGNLAVAGQSFALARWLVVNSNVVPTTAYGPGDPGNGSGDRWGDTMAVRGAGPNTQILLGSYAGTNVALLTTVDGLNFTAKPISVSGVPAGFAGLGVAFGAGNTFWAKTQSNDLRQIAFSLSGTGSPVQDYGSPNSMVANLTGIGVDVTNAILGGVSFDSPNDLQLWQLSTNASAPVLYEQAFFPAFNANVQANAAVTLKNGRAYALDVNNGLMALRYAKSNPTLSWTNPSAIAYGTALSSNQLDATVSVPGTFAYTPPAGTVLNAGTNTLSVVFTPNDLVDYTSATDTVTLLVSPAPLTVTPNSTNRLYGQPNPAFTGTLTGVVNGDNISVTFVSSATTNSPAGGYSIVPVFADPNNRLANYSIITNSGTLTVNQAPLTVTASPESKTYGQTLTFGSGSTQFTSSGLQNGETIGSVTLAVSGNGGAATAPVSGSPYTITPSAATGGTFSPNNYAVTYVAGTLTVNKATPTVTTLPVASAITYGQTLASSTFSGGAETVPGSFAFTTPSTVPAVGTALQSVTFTPTDTNDYNAVVTSVSVTVNPALPVITWAAPAAITNGTALSSNQLDATASVPGSFLYTPPAGTVPPVGTDTLTVVFTPTNTLDYSSVTDSVSLTVLSAATTGQGLVIYDGALENAWQNWGWATLNYTNPSPVYAGESNSISVTITSAYAGIQLYHADLNSTPYASVSFWLNGGSDGDQSLQMYGLLDSGGVANAAQSARYQLSPPAANTWRQYTVPLSSLGVADATNFTGFVIQDAAGSAEPTFYLADIQLVSAAGPALTPLTINAGQPIRTADARWFGINGTIWDDNFDMPQTLGLMTNMGTCAVRFPGGSLSDDYHWLYNRQDDDNWAWSTSPANFIHVITNLNAEAMTTVNYGTGFTNEAAAWVAYVNATTNNPQSLGVDATGFNWLTAGYWAALRASAPLATDDGMNFLRISRPAPLGLKYWEIGNEEYGSWETDSNTVPHDPYTYAQRAGGYIALMKAVDPTIKIGVVVTPGVNSYVNNTSHPAVDPVTGLTNYGWTPVLLATLNSLGVTPDFAIYHNYPQNPGNESDAGLLASSTVWASVASDLRGQISDYLGSHGTNLELVCTEDNSVSSAPGKQSVSLVNGLYKVDNLAQLMQTEFNGLFWWALRNGQETDGNMSSSLYGWRLYGDYGIVDSGFTNVYPTYYTTKLMTHFVQPGDTVVTATSGYSLLSTYAVRRQNGSLTILIVNKDPVNTLTGLVAVAGFTPSSSGALYAYGMPQDNAAETGIGSPDVMQTNLLVAGPSFSYAFPPYSATVLVLAPAQAPVAIMWTDPAAIPYGTALGTNQLDATATYAGTNVPGRFAYNPPTTSVPNAGTNVLSVNFTPNDTVDYTSATDTVSLVVSPAALTVTANSTNRLYGQTNPVFTGTVVGVTNGDNITVTFVSSATANSPVGGYAIVPVFADPNNRLANYLVTTNLATLTVNKATPSITTLPVASAITYGQTLASSQLSGGAGSVSGSFAFTSPSTAPSVGTALQSVSFTPIDTNDYNSVITSVSQVVLPAPLTVTANNASRPQGQANPVFTGTLTGVTNGDNITATYTCNATTTSPAGTYPIVPSLVDPGNRLENYAVTTNYGTLTVTSTNGTSPVTFATIQVLASFSDTNGAGPADLTLGNDGNLYGTTITGGNVNLDYGLGYGTVFRVTTNGVLTMLVAFNETNGAALWDPGTTDDSAYVTLGNDGNFYGTTAYGGAYDDGTVFQMTPSGILTTLVSFNGTNGGDPGALTLGNDGNFYGTTAYGGAYDDGMVFRVTTNGVLSTLASFNWYGGIWQPNLTLTLGNDGNFYGTTTSGGAYDDGTVFQMTPNGVLSTFASFNWYGGIWQATLTLGNDGNFYGTSTSGGAYDDGTVFQMTPSGVLTTLVSFNGTNGGYPGALTLGNDGNFYGTTASGGAYDDGTVFQMTPSGVLTTLVSFNGTNDFYANALTLGSDGNFYGIARGGNYGFGEIFKLILSSSPLPGTPVLTWNNPTAIPYGTALGTNQLDATSTYAGTNLPGSFAYTSANGAVLNAGTNTLSVVFTPNDLVDYTSATTSVSLVVSPAALTVTANATNRIYGQANPVFTGTLTGVTNGDNITVNFVSSASPNSPVGGYAIVPVFADPNNRLANYSVTTNSATLTVNPAPLTVTATPESKTYGQTLTFGSGSTQFTSSGLQNGETIGSVTLAVSGNGGAATAPVSGSPYTITPSAATGGTFSPNNYAITYVAGTLTVNKATPTVTTLPVASAITYGQTLASSTFSGGAETVPGSFAFTTPSTIPAVGTALQSVTFTPTDTNDYNAVVTSVSVTVNPALPVITWAAPAAITNGTALSSNQLDATASVPGSFIYTPPAGTVPTVGTDTLTVVFSPTNTLDYSSVTDSVSLVVSASTTGQGLVIYDGALENAWQNWGWATLNYTNPSPVYAGESNSISVTITSAYAGIQLYHADLNSTPYASVSFWLNGGSDGDQSLQMYGLLDSGGVANAAQSAIYDLSPPAANTWQQYTVPLSSLGVANATNFTGFVIQDDAGSAEPTFYLADIQLNSAVTSIPPVTVTVNAAQPLAAMPLLGLGVCTAVYDNQLIDPSIVPRLKAAGLGAVRFPGGSYADIFNWETTTVNDDGYINSDDSFDNFMNTLVNPAGAQAIITVNYGSNPDDNAGGDPNVAAAWVAHANLTNHWGIAYWEIGNEISGNGYYGTNLDWEYDLHYPETSAAARVGQPALSPAAYGTNALQFISAMKAQDATIKCGVGFDTGDPAYNSQLLGVCGGSVDFVIIHYYPASDPGSLLAASAGIVNTVQNTLTQLTNNVGVAHAGQMQILVTETGSDTVTGAPVSLFAADNYLTWIENGIVNVDYQILHDDMLTSAQQPGHAYYGAQMAHLLANVGDTFLQTSSGQPLLRVHATARADGQTGIMLLNLDPTLPITANINITNGAALATIGTSYEFGLTNFIGTNDFPSYPVATNTVPDLGNTFTVVVPPYTIINLLIPAAVRSMPLITVLPVATPITYGQTLASSQLSGGAGSVPGNFAFTTPSAVPSAGVALESVTFTPNDTNNFTTVTTTVSVTVNQAAPAVSWTKPAAITYGTALGTNQLDAAASVSGSFAYYPPTGTVPAAGTNTLSVVFTPANPVDYTSATTSVSLVVSPAALTVTGNNTNRLYGQANPVFTGTVVGVTNGDNITVTFVSSATTNSPVGGYAIAPIFADPNNRLANYTITTNSATLTVNPAPLTVTASPESKPYGQTLTFGSGSTQFSSSGLQNGETIGSVTLAVGGNGGAATALPGSYTITPSAATGGTFSSNNYAITYHTGTLTVNAAAPPTITVIVPNTGSTNGGTLTTITGTGFETGASVSFGSNLASSVNVNSATNLTAVTPAGLAGAVNVVLTNADGNVTTFSNGFAYVATPSSLSITNQPISQAALPGGSVTFSVGVAGTGQFTYQWQFNGTNLPNEIINTVAGNGSWGYAGDGGAATHAELSAPSDLAVDAVGNLFIADFDNNVIRKLATNGIITTVAGNGNGGYAGDGGAATNAQLNYPSGVAVDAVGNLFISDSGNNVIRKLDTNDIITTVAGNGYVGGFPDYEDGGYTGDGGAATNAEMNVPSGVAVDAVGNLFIADSANNVIRKVGTNGIITTVAGDGFDAGSYTTFYGGAVGHMGGYTGNGGAATNAEMFSPNGVAVDAIGNLFIADSGNNVIRKVGTNGIITAVAGIGIPSSGYTGNGGPATNAELNVPSGVVVDATGNLFIADYLNSVIRKVAPNGIITTVAGNGLLGYTGDGGAATNSELELSSDVGVLPSIVAVDATGNLFIADQGNNLVREVVSSQGPTLTLNDVANSNAGNYQVVVTGSGGSVTSSVAVLTVTTVTTYFSDLQPNQTSAYGSTVTLSGTVSAPGPVYPAPGESVTVTINGNAQTATISDATGDFSLVYQLGTIPANASPYAITYAYAGDGLLVPATHADTTLTVTPALAILNQPASDTVLPGGNATFSVGVSSSGPFTCQWWFNGGAVTGATNVILNLSAVTSSNAGNYTVVVTNAYGSVTSAPPAVLTVASGVAVTSLADSGPGSLRQAIQLANGPVINIVTNGTISLTSGELLITNSLTIIGPGATNLILNGNQASRVFDIRGGGDLEVGPMNGPHDSHTATRLNDGTVFIIGGPNAAYSTVDATGTNFVVSSESASLPEVYDPVAAVWNQVNASYYANFGFIPYFGHTATLLSDGTVLVAGGFDSGAGSGVANVSRYYPIYSRDNLDGFTPDSTLNTARYDHAAALLASGQVLVTGGYDINNLPLASVEIYNPTTFLWTTAANSLKTARASHTLTTLTNGYLLVAGGFGTNGALANVELCNPPAGAWVPTNSLNTARYDHTATLLNDGTVLIVGGLNVSNLPLASVELFNPTNGTWTLTSPLTTARYEHTATLLANGKVLVAGGSDGSGPLASVELFDPTTRTWSLGSPLNLARELQTATVLTNGIEPGVLLAGGDGSDGSLVSAEIYQPDAGIVVNLSGLTIANGHAPDGVPSVGQGGGSQGGGIFNAATLTLTACAISGNSAGNGLDASSTNGVLVPAGNGGDGGGINNVGNLTLNDCTVSGNTAGQGGAGGSAVYGSTTVSLVNGGTGGNGGAINNQGTLTVNTCTLAGNQAGAAGTNAVSGDGANGVQGGNGGAIFNAGKLALISATLSGNAAGAGGAGGNGSQGGPGGNGGAICNASDVATLWNTLIALNTAGAGGASGGGGPGTTGLGLDLFGAFTTRGHNLLGKANGSTGLTNGVSGDLVGTIASPINPLLGPLQANGGPTLTMALLAGSPALNAGDDTLTGTDQRGDPRYSGSGVDIGAYELQSITVPLLVWAKPAAIVYGTALSSNQLNATALASGNIVPGSYAYSPTNGVVLSVGTNFLSVAFTPGAPASYTNASTNTSLVVLPAALTVTANATNRIYGQANPVFTGTLTGVTNGDNITVNFVSSASPNSPVGGYAIVPVFADPNNRLANYNVTTNSATLTVNQAPLTVTAAPESKTYGQTLTFGSGSTQYTSSGLQNGETIGSVTLAVSGNGGAATAPVSGSPYTITPSAATGGTFSPNNYAITYVAGALTVNKATPTVTTLPVASAITYGQTLASSTFSGGAETVPGSFAFTTPSTIPAVGTGLQSVTFTPTDTNDYNAVATSVSVTVNSAMPVIIWTNPAAITNGTALSSNQLDATASVPGSFIYTPPAGTVPLVGTNMLMVVFTPTNTLDYSSATDSVSLVVLPGGGTKPNTNPPALAIADSGTQIILTWPTNPAGFVLESTTMLNLTNGWTPNAALPVIVNGLNTVTNPTTGTQQYYRLYQNTNSTVIITSNGMALIPAGSFTMGNVADTNDLGDAAPINVYVSAFYMDQTDVTEALWQQVYNWALNHGYSFDDPGSVNDGNTKGPNYPLIFVNWYDCVKWCNARSEMAGLRPAYYTNTLQTAVYRTGDIDLSNACVNWQAGYRLPTEAEWEKAGRGGLGGQRFPWGATISESQANYNSCYCYSYDLSDTGHNPGFDTGNYPYTSPVTSFAPNGYGLYDMAGNVTQWCWDWYGTYAGGSDPHGPTSGAFRVYRGGSWLSVALYCRTAYRGNAIPDSYTFNNYIFGFRSVLPSGQ